MKKHKDRANEKKEVMHINDSHMTCEECENTGHSGNNCAEVQEDVNFVNNNKLLSSSTKSRMESVTEAELQR
jgi:hypothetical protein